MPSPTPGHYQHRGLWCDDCNAQTAHRKVDGEWKCVPCMEREEREESAKDAVRSSEVERVLAWQHSADVPGAEWEQLCEDEWFLGHPAVARVEAYSVHMEWDGLLPGCEIGEAPTLEAAKAAAEADVLRVARCIVAALEGGGRG